MPSLLVFCTFLLLLATTFFTIRLHDMLEMKNWCRRMRSSGSPLASLHTNLTKNAVTEDFYDDYFGPLLESYREVARQTRALPQRHSFRSGVVPKVVMYVEDFYVNSGWYEEHILDIQDGLCPLPCDVTNDRNQVKTADAVLVHLLSVSDPQNVESQLGGRDPTQPWIMFEPEAPYKPGALASQNLTKFNSVFNRTMHYRRDSDIMLLHGFVVRRGHDVSILPPTWRRLVQVDQSSVNTTRKLAVAFISDCKDRSGRLDYIRAMQPHAQVDVYGKCGDLKCGHSMLSYHGYRVDEEYCMQMAGNNYLFYLAFESAMCEDYVTEKLYNLMYFAIVPVVLGAADYSKLLPPNSYINARDYQPRELAKKLLHLAQNPKEYQQYLKWRQYYQPSTVGGTRVLCHLCVRLHDPSLYHHNVIHDFESWYATRANCNRSGTLKIHLE